MIDTRTDEQRPDDEINKAWRTKIGDIESIVAASTRAKAKSRTLFAAYDAGYDSVKWTDIRAVRAPIHDAWALTDRSRSCWSEEFLIEKRARIVAAEVK